MKPDPNDQPNGVPQDDRKPPLANGTPEGDVRWLRSVVENSSEIVTIVDPDGTLRYASPAFGRMLGYDPEEVVGTLNVLDLVHPDDLPHVLEETEKALSVGGVATNEAEYRFRHKDGSWRWVESVGTYLLDDPHVRVLVVQTRDVTGRKEAETALRESEERFRAQYKNLPVPTYTWRREAGDFVLVDYNDAANWFTGDHVKALLGSIASELLSERPVLLEMIRRCFRERTTLRREMPWRMLRTGEEKRFVVTCVRVPPDLVMVHIEDTTERARAEERLRFQAQLLGAVGEAVIALDTERRVVYWNRAAEELYGFSAEEMMGRRLMERVVPQDLRRQAEDVMARVREGLRWTGEFVVRRRDGTAFPVEATNTPVFGEDGEQVGVVGVLRDVTERKEAERRLVESERRFASVVSNAHAYAYRCLNEPGWPNEYASDYALDLTGYPPEDLLVGGKVKLGDLIVEEDRARVWYEVQEALAEGRGFELRYAIRRKDGQIRHVHEYGRGVWDGDGKVVALEGLLYDVTESREAEEALRRSEARLAEAQRLAHLGGWEWDVRTDEITWSDEVYRIYGLEPQSCVPSIECFMNVVHPDDKKRVRKTIDEALEGSGPYDVEHRVVRPDGEVRTVHRRAEAVRGAEGKVLRMIGTAHDVTERKVLEDRLRYRAFHDALTNLPNRQLFLDRLGHAMARTGRRRGRRVAVLFMDLDDFKVVNDSLGHETGDLLLVVVAERLKGCLRPEDTLARFGGDEFVVLIEDVQSPEDAVRVAERIIEGFGRPFVLEGRELYARVSIGIALGQDSTQSPEDLMRNADMAMYRAKDEGSGHRVFDPAMHERALGRLETENDLRRAVERGEFVVHYQPIVRLGDRGVWGMEALVRWEHPERGLLNPDEFVPVAEESGLVVPMGEQVLREACFRAVEWQKRFPRTLPVAMSVNLSARQLSRPDLVETVERVLGETGLEGRCLTLDVTETVYVRALEGNTRVLDRLSTMGVKISIDDFGTGYSSLSYLKKLPADAIKIDKSFVKGLGQDTEDTAIVRMIIELAHTLGMEVVAEGVEDEEQVTLLEEMGCDFAQGFHFSEPLPPKEARGSLAT